MTYDQDTIDEYRKPEYHGEHLSYDEASERYETEDPKEFVANAVDALCGADEIPEPLRRRAARLVPQDGRLRPVSAVRHRRSRQAVLTVTPLL